MYGSTIACAAGYILAKAFKAAAANSFYYVRETALNSINHNRTLKDIDSRPGFIMPPSLSDTGYEGSAVSLLHRETKQGDFSLSTHDRYALKPEEKDTFEIKLYDNDDYRNGVSLLVSGDTTNGDFFKLWDAIKDQFNGALAANAFTQAASGILGDKLISSGALDHTVIAQPEAPKPA